MSNKKNMVIFVELLVGNWLSAESQQKNNG